MMAGDIDAIPDLQVRASRPNPAALWKVAEIALRSVEPKSAHRPTMNEIVQELQGPAALEKLDSDSSSNSIHYPPPPPAPLRFHHSRIPSAGYSDLPSDSKMQVGLDSSSYPAPR